MSKTIDVYQAGPDRFFLYQSLAYELGLVPDVFDIPHLAYTDAPPVAPAGMQARRNVEGTAWDVEEDHREDVLFYVKTPATADKPAVLEHYQFGQKVDVEGVEVSYDGGGSVPDWLTDVPPTPPEPSQPEQPSQIEG